MFPSRQTVERLRKDYPKGTRVELVQMNDVQAPPVGTRGTVIGVDDIGSLLVAWDNGSSLNVVYGEDLVKKSDSVVVICNGEKEIWDTRQKAIDLYFEAMNSTEGSEQSRYTDIYIKLILGFGVCSDESDE